MNTPLFDRSDLQSLLKKRVEGFQAGYRQNVALIGPSGMGKSTLVREFLQREAGPGSLLLPLSMEVGPEESPSEWLLRFVRTVLYSVLQLLRKPELFPTRLPELLEACSVLVPRTTALSRKIAASAENGRWDEAYDWAWDLPHLLTQETGHRVLLVLDEFHRLRELPVQEPFRSLGRKIMVQSTTLYLLVSSEPETAGAILHEGLALLFGKFESVEVPPLGSTACRRAIRSVRPGEPVDPLSEHLLIELAEGRPHRLRLLVENWGRLPAGHLLELLEVLFLDPDSALRQEFDRRLRLLPVHRNRALCLQVLEKVASGAHRLPDLCAQLERPRAQVVQALRFLEESRFVVKEGIFYRIPERLFRVWLVTAYPILEGVALMGPLQSKAHFRRAAGAWVERLRQAVGLPMEEHLRRLLLRWNDERVEMDGRRLLLPRFRQVEKVPGPLEQVSLLARPAARQKGWWVVPWSGSLDETQARQIVQQMRAFVPLKEYRKVLIGASPAELNARLVLQQAKVRFWDLAALNLLLDLYGLIRLPVPEGAEGCPGRTIPLPEALPFESGGCSSEQKVTG